MNLDRIEEMLVKEARGATGAESVDAAAVDTAALGAVIAARAEREGLLDVRYAELDSPFGPLLAVSTPTGLVHLGYPDRDVEAQLVLLAERISPRMLETRTAFGQLERQLDEYFGGRRRQFELPVDWRLSSGFARDVLVETARIPYGQTRTYGEMAESVGRPRAFRAAGTALGSNSIPIVVPCHRVLRSGGGLGGYGGGLEIKTKLLELEGVLQPG